MYKHAYIVKIGDFGFRAFFQKFRRFQDDTASFFDIFIPKTWLSHTLLLAVFKLFSLVY